MSDDFKIQNKCDHLINWEEGDLQTDLRSIYVKYPIAAVSSVRLRINWTEVPLTEYDVVTRDVVGVVEPPLYIYMNNKIKSFEPLVEVTYTTQSKYCPKCGSVNVLDDFIYTRDGDILLNRDEGLLVQNVEKFIITRQTSNIFHEWIGTDLHTLIDSKILDLDFLRTQIVDQVNQAINKLQNVQRQALAANVNLSEGELFDKLISIDLERTEDPTIALVIVVFTAQSGKTLEFSQFLELSYARERRALS